jgi:hypothetical protein
MSKLSDLMKGYGTGEITLPDTVHALLCHAWVLPARFSPHPEKLPAVVEDSWEEIEHAFNTGVITFDQYRSLSRSFDEQKKSHGIIVP